MIERPSIKNKESLKRVTPEEAIALLKHETVLFLAMPPYILALEDREAGLHNYTDEELADLKATISKALETHHIYLKPSEGTEDVFETFVTLFKNRAIATS